MTNRKPTEPKDPAENVFQEIIEEEFGIDGVDRHNTYDVDLRTGEVRHNYELHRVETFEDTQGVVTALLKGSIKPHEAHAVIFGAILNYYQEKIYIQDRIYRAIDAAYNFDDPDYFKSTFSMTKIENRLMSYRRAEGVEVAPGAEAKENQEAESQSIESMYEQNVFKQLKDRESFIQAMLACLETAREFIKITERSSWGYRSNKAD